MLPIVLLFFFSGFAALVYELLWFRHLGFIFGNTVYAATAVLTAYMAGLAVGARWFGARVARSRNPVRLFGLLETSIGLYAVCVPVLFVGLRMVYRLLYQRVSSDLVVLTPAWFVLAVAIMVVPTILMGGTLPVLAHGLARQDRGFSARLSVLYGVNTFGAMTGLLAAGFFLIPTLGLRATNFAAVAVNLVIGGIALTLSRRTGDAAGEADAAPRPVAARTILSGQTRIVLGAAAMAGFLGLALEVVWFRTLVLIFGSTTYSFCIMLAVFLFGIAAGSLVLGWLADRVRRPVLLLALGFAVIGAYTIFSMHLYNRQPEFLLHHLVRRSFAWRGMLEAKALITLSFLLAPTLVLGLLFNVSAKAVRGEDDSSGDAVGRVYWYNTFGSVAGSLAAGFLLLPHIGIAASLILLGMAALAGAVLLCLLARPRRPAQAVIGGMAVVLMGLAAVFRPHWDPLVLTSGAYFNPNEYLRGEEVIFWERIANQRLRYFHEGVTATISVVETKDGVLYFVSGGKVEADTTRESMMLQRLQGHLPMLFHPDPRRVLNIGLGAGVTFGALGCYPTDYLEVIEIESRVADVAREWGERNHRIVERKDARITIADGRNYLFCTTNRFDVITSDPFEPVHSGAGHLYTVEHFRQARDRLAAGGIMGQYLPLYEMSRADFFTIMRSFAEVFPASVIFFTGTDTVMLGFKDDRIEINAGEVRAKFDLPAVRDSLAEIGVKDPDTILEMLVADLSTLLTGETAGATLNTDNLPVIEYSTPKSALRYTNFANAQVLLDHFTPIPAALLKGYSDEQVATIQSGHAGLRLVLEAAILKDAGKTGEAFAKLVEARKRAPGNPVVNNEALATLLASASAMMEAGHLEQAAYQHQLALTYDPTSFWALHRYITLCMMGRQEALGVEWLDRAQAIYPDAAAFWSLRATYATTRGQWQEALGHCEKAVESGAWQPELWLQLAVCADRVGDPERAAEARAKADELVANSVALRKVEVRANPTAP